MAEMICLMGLFVEGTADSWAERWHEESQEAWVWPTVEVWANGTLVKDGYKPLIGSAHTLTTKIMRTGVSLGWWRFDLGARRWVRSAVFDRPERDDG